MDAQWMHGGLVGRGTRERKRGRVDYVRIWYPWTYVGE
jgi:hypothetical protein